MIKKIYIVRKLNAANDPNVNYVAGLIDRVSRGGQTTAPVVEERDIDHETIVIAVGGDGTMLEALRLAHKYNAIATGINLGKVGFLTDFAHDDKQLINILYGIIHGEEKNPNIEERILLECILHDKGQESVPLARRAFNEFVISNKLSDTLLKYTLFIGDRCAGVHRANALIIGTPTGSTAYTLSAGGGLLLPSMEAMQIVPVAPISMTSRPIIVPSHEDVRISVETEGTWLLKADGGTVLDFNHLEWIDLQLIIKQASTKVKILHSKYWSFFDMLTLKLGWKSN